MKKQTKLTAVLSAAALLAIGASMISFAAGWQQNDDSTWSYYDSDDDMVTGEWKKDGNKWFYLDDDGIMLTDSWVDDEQYVGDDGAMLVNAWKKTVSDDDIDDPDEDGESWYYFDSKGKKITDDEKIGGKTYYFDTDGKMRDGWWQNGNDVYYLGEEDDGARKSGWLWLEAPSDDDGDNSVDVNGHKDDNDECDEEGWYYFGSDGKMYKDAKKKKVNGKFYFFNAHGQMLYEWINDGAVKPGSNAQLDGFATPGTTRTSDMIYTNVVEEGWRADGWYEIDGSEDLGSNNDTDWYYFKDGAAKKAVEADQNGLRDDGAEVFRARIKVEGKYFCFNDKGQMQTGLQLIGSDMYYFDDNGYMKTGKLSDVEEENDSFNYYFQTKSGGNGKGIDGEKDGYIYWFGKRIEADDDYRVYKVEGSYYLVNNKGKAQKSSSKDYDVENTNATDVKFTFINKGYQLNPDQKDSPTKDAAQAAINAASVPTIELLDSVMTTSGIKNSNIIFYDGQEVTQVDTNGHFWINGVEYGTDYEPVPRED